MIVQETPISNPSPPDTPLPQSSTSSTFDINPPSITRIFSDAALYKQVIEDPERASLVIDNESIKDFAELVGKDLDSPEKTLVGRFAQLSVEDLSWGEVGRYTEEPEVYSDEDDSSAESLEKDQGPLHEGPEAFPPVLPQSTSEIQRAKLSSKLPPDEIVTLLKEEFGELTPPEVEERLLIEIDAALVQDVILMGVIHVTTHRLAFHAALPEQHPSVYPGNNVIKSGPAVIHRTGFHRKRRVWLELSPDFLCTFPSASEDDRIRPLKSYQLSSIKEVRPEDAQRPRYIRALASGPGLGILQNVDIEFDTIEASREWRRELAGAIFLYRRKLMAALESSEAGESDSVKISIPLPCLESISRSRFAELLRFVTLVVSTQGGEPRTPGFRTGGHSNYEDVSADLHTVQFAVAPFDASLDRLEDLVETSKKHVYSSIGSSLKTKVVVDFASVTLKELQDKKNGISPDAGEDGSKEKFICDILGIPYSSDVWMTETRLHLGPITTGYLVVAPQWIGFWSRYLTVTDERYRIPTSTIRSVSVIDPWLKPLPHYGLQLDIQGQSSLRFQFRGEVSRNEAVRRVKDMIEQARVASPPATPPAKVLQLATTGTSRSTSPVKQEAHDSASSSSTNLSHRSFTFLAPMSSLADHPARRQLRMNSDLYLRLPKAVNIPRSMILSMPNMHFVCITIGSRGDVQPYIALGVGLLKEGHRVTIVTHEEYKEWIEDYGIQHRTAGGDPGSLMKLSVENKMFSPQFFKESISNFRSWLDELLRSSWDQCRDAEVILESPYAFGGVHIAEALSIPYFRVCTMPWTKTTQFPHPFIGPPVETSRFNSMSYVLFDNVLWVATAPQINRWRKEVLGLNATDMSHSVQAKIPIMYNFSSSVVPKPLDWNELAHPSGYWFLDNPEGHNWKPPSTLLTFMSKARSDKKPLVYIGFGSITVPNPTEVTQRLYAAVTKSGVRAIISKGWSARMHSGTAAAQDEKEVVPEDCYMLDKVPHDWLFPKVDAALHHGGAGTTSASLRAGIPTLIKPWFGDQFFWASRVQKLGAGLRVPSLRVGDVADALIKATSDRIMKEKAALVGEKIRSEDGVLNAIQFMSVYLPRAIRTAQHQTAEAIVPRDGLVGLGSASSSKEEDVEGKSNACPSGWRSIITQ